MKENTCDEIGLAERVNDKESVQKIRILFQTLAIANYPTKKRGLPFCYYFTGIQKCIGTSIWTNTEGAALQLLFALAMSQHPSIYECVSPENKLDSKWAKRLAYEQVLKGMKILDLGCSDEPVFARCARRLGADSYTSDIMPVDGFRYHPRFFTEEDRKTEIAKHICLDLNSANAAGAIKNKFGGDFDLVTESLLDAGSWNKAGYNSCDKGDKIALPLLKEDGLYYYPPICCSRKDVLEKALRQTE